MKIIIRKMLILLAGLFVHSIGFAAIFNVNDTADGYDANAGDGICATAMGTCTLRAAIDEANALLGADTINLPVGTYIILSVLQISSGLELIGENTNTTIVRPSASSTTRVFSIVNDLPLTMSGFTIEGGNGGTSGAGGGIFLNSSNEVTLSAMNIRNNAALVGSGIASGSEANQLNIVDSIIELNTGITSGSLNSAGGAIAFESGTISITRTTIRDNTANLGGAIYIGSGSISDLTIRDSTISNNTATVLVSGGGTEMGGNGGAIRQTKAITKIINSTISNNKAFNSGGGITLDYGSSSVLLFNSTIVNNIADFDENGNGQGGGIFGGTLNGGGQFVLELSNSILAENISNSGVGPDCETRTLSITSNGNNLIGDNTNCSISANTGDQVGNSVAPINPMIGPLADNGGPTFTHALLDGSPAIDAGNSTNCIDSEGAIIATDQRGHLRPRDGGSGMIICDIGAFEKSTPPVADAGDDQVVAFGESVNLTGTGSSAVSGIASYSWSEIPSATVILENATTDSASFIAPAESIVLTFELTLTDNDGLFDVDTVTVTVNAAPVANAGIDQSVNEGQVTLDGSNSVDSDGSVVAFSWAQLSGTAVSINNADSIMPTFDAPIVPGELNFQLTVTDNHGFTHSDTVLVSVNASPVANAGLDRTVETGDSVSLNGAGSDDSDGIIQSYSWIQLFGETVILNNANTATPDFIAPAITGDLSFQLTVTDSNGATSNDSVTVTVIQPPSQTPGNQQPDGGDGGGGSTDFIFLVMLVGSSVLRRRIINRD